MSAEALLQAFLQETCDDRHSGLIVASVVVGEPEKRHSPVTVRLVSPSGENCEIVSHVRQRAIDHVNRPGITLGEMAIEDALHTLSMDLTEVVMKWVTDAGMRSLYTAKEAPTP